MSKTTRYKTVEIELKVPVKVSLRLFIEDERCCSIHKKMKIEEVKLVKEITPKDVGKSLDDYTRNSVMGKASNGKWGVLI